LEHASGATIKTFLEPFASAKMSNTAMTAAWRRIKGTTSTSVLLKQTASSRIKMTEN
jgi:hypothetical protein